MTLYEIGLLGAALFGCLGALAFVSMFTEAGSWRVFFGLALITGLFAGIAHLNGADGINTDDLVPTISKVVEMVRGPSQ